MSDAGLIAAGLTEEERERFWAKVDRRGADECWPWLASTAPVPNGYGQFAVRRKIQSSHRLVIGLLRGQPGQALHSCDNRLCVNPAHLRVGTHRENAADMVKRGRSASKLSFDDAVMVHEFHRLGWSAVEIARRFGVTGTAIRAILAGVGNKGQEVHAASKARFESARRHGGSVDACEPQAGFGPTELERAAIEYVHARAERFATKSARNDCECSNEDRAILPPEFGAPGRFGPWEKCWERNDSIPCEGCVERERRHAEHVKAQKRTRSAWARLKRIADRLRQDDIFAAEAS